MNWLEYLETKKEDLNFIRTELSNIKMLLAWLIVEENATREIKDLEKRTDILTKLCNDLEAKPINRLYRGSENQPNIETGVEFYSDREKEIATLMKGLSFLSLAVEQRFKGSEIAQFTYFQPTQSLSSEFPGLHRAAGCVLTDFFDLINGEEWSNQPTEPLPLVVFRDGGYAVDPEIRVAVIPIEDRDRIRFWVSLGHEAFHEKVGNLLYNVRLAQVDNKRALNALEKLAKKITPEDVKFINDTINSLTQDIAENYGYVDKYPVVNIDERIERFFRSQVEEMLCDVGATILAGPADFLASSSQWELSYQNSLYGFYKSMNGLSHPPDYVRLRYMLDVLEGLEYPKADIVSWLQRVEKVRADEALLAKSEPTYDPEGLIPMAHEKNENYIQLVHTKYLDKIGGILDYLIVEKNIYDGERWTNLKEKYHAFMRDGSIFKKANSIDLMNMAWLKRQEVYDEIGSKGGPLAFGEWHKRERKLYEDAICFLSNRYSDRICRMGGNK